VPPIVILVVDINYLIREKEENFKIKQCNSYAHNEAVQGELMTMLEFFFAMSLLI
jgi:hypothetical protein